MKEIWNQNDIDRPYPNNALYREILEAFEDHHGLLDSSHKCHVIAFLKSAFLIVLEYFDDDVPEVSGPVLCIQIPSVGLLQLFDVCCEKTLLHLQALLSKKHSNGRWFS
jgi:hypothetical protein